MQRFGGVIAFHIGVSVRCGEIGISITINDCVLERVWRWRWGLLELLELLDDDLVLFLYCLPNFVN